MVGLVSMHLSLDLDRYYDCGAEALKGESSSLLKDNS
jgi:hypothetical protein